MGFLNSKKCNCFVFQTKQIYDLKINFEIVKSVCFTKKIKKTKHSAKKIESNQT